jgi:hypothetical protein
MEDTKRSVSQDQSEPLPAGERRRLSKVVHDHKGNASVVWYDAPADYERPVFEIEGPRQPPHSPKRTSDTGSLAIEAGDTHNPYTRTPASEHKRGSGARTDLRKLSAWIKLMRQLEESKRGGGNEED